MGSTRRSTVMEACSMFMLDERENCLSCTKHTNGGQRLETATLLVHTLPCSAPARGSPAGNRRAPTQQAELPVMDRTHTHEPDAPETLNTGLSLVSCPSSALGSPVPPPAGRPPADESAPSTPKHRTRAPEPEQRAGWGYVKELGGADGRLGLRGARELSQLAPVLPSEHLRCVHFRWAAAFHGFRVKMAPGASGPVD